MTNQKPKMLIVLSLLLLAGLLVACGSNAPTQNQATATLAQPSPTVAVETTLATTLTTPTPQEILPAATPEPTPTIFVPTLTPVPDATIEPTPTALAVASPTVAAETPPTDGAVLINIPAPEPPLTPTPAPDPVVTGLIVEPPVKDSGRWIDFNLGDGVTRLVEGRKVIRELPSAYGYGIPGSPTDYFSTAPGQYQVYSKQEALHQDTEYTGLYFQGWVGFDSSRANGFHSFLLDDKASVVDSKLGPISHGCVRTEDWKAVFDFAEIGMPVIVHGTSPHVAQARTP